MLLEKETKMLNKIDFMRRYHQLSKRLWNDDEVIEFTRGEFWSNLFFWWHNLLFKIWFWKTTQVFMFKNFREYAKKSKWN